MLRFLFSGNRPNGIRDRLKRFSIRGLHNDRSASEIYEDRGLDMDTHKAVIEITVPARYQQTQFSGIQISIPDYYLTLCEVEVYNKNEGKLICTGLHAGMKKKKKKKKKKKNVHFHFLSF